MDGGANAMRPKSTEQDEIEELTLLAKELESRFKAAMDELRSNVKAAVLASAARSVFERLEPTGTIH